MIPYKTTQPSVSPKFQLNQKPPTFHQTILLSTEPKSAAAMSSLSVCIIATRLN